MGTTFRAIIDPSSSLEEASALAERVLRYMRERGIIRAERTDCVLGAGGGYAPGKNVGEALATWTPHSSDGVPLPSERVISDLLRWNTNGVNANVGGTVFHNFGAGLNVVRCPLCLANQLKGDWGSAVDEWFKGDDEAAFECSSCRECSPIVEWRFNPPWAFGNLGFTFWSWPPLNRKFVRQVESILGHRVMLIAGKM